LGDSDELLVDLVFGDGAGGSHGNRRIRSGQVGGRLHDERDVGGEWIDGITEGVINEGARSD